MSDNGQVEEGGADAVFQVHESITVPDRDLSPAEMHKIMRQVSRVCNFLASLVMKQAAIANDARTAGAGHPICQNILNAAAQADSAALQLAGPPQIMQAGGKVPVAVPRRN
jgi:hypothetical protein